MKKTILAIGCGATLFGATLPATLAGAAIMSKAQERKIGKKVLGQVDDSFSAAERVEIAPSGRLIGNIAAPRITIADGATLLIHDAQYRPDEYPDHVGWGHSSMIDAGPGRDDIVSIPVPANKIADGLGNPKVANMVALGAFLVPLTITIRLGVNVTDFKSGPFIGSDHRPIYVDVAVHNQD